MSADVFKVFDVFQEELGAGTHDGLKAGTDVIKGALIDSGWTPNTATDTTFSTIDANENSDTGYTAGGATITATWDAATGTLTFDGSDLSWTAGAGGITTRYLLVYNSSAGGTNDIICYSLLDNTPADVTAAEGVDLKVNMNASGLFTIAQ